MNFTFRARIQNNHFFIVQNVCWQIKQFGILYPAGGENRANKAHNYEIPCSFAGTLYTLTIVFE